MQLFAQESRRQFVKPLACALALLSLLFLLQVTPHGHANGQDESACWFCQAAHVSITPAISGIALSIPLVLLGEVIAPSVGAPTESFLSHSHSRAPPAEFHV